MPVACKREGFPGGSGVKNPPASAGDVGSIPGSGRSPEEGNSNPLQYSSWHNLRGAWQATVYVVTKSQTQPSMHALLTRCWLKKKKNSHFSLTKTIKRQNINHKIYLHAFPGIFKLLEVFLPGESHRWRRLVGCCPQGRTELDTAEATQHAYMHWRKKWQPPPVFLPGESQGWGSLVGCHLWGRTESDTTKATQQQQQQDVCLMEVCLFRILLMFVFKILMRKMVSLKVKIKCFIIHPCKSSFSNT